MWGPDNDSDPPAVPDGVTASSPCPATTQRVADVSAFARVWPSPRSIADAAVIGVKDAEGEEVPKAFIVRQQGADIDEDGVMSFVSERIAAHKKVRRVEFIDQIPKSASGKILRKDLRARENAPA